jgi:hypothetical protein
LVIPVFRRLRQEDQDFEARVGSIAQVVEHLPRKHKALIKTPVAPKEKKKRKSEANQDYVARLCL